MLFQIVGMELDQTGQHVIAIEVDGAGQLARALGHFGDHPVMHDQRAAENLILQHQPCISKNAVPTIAHHAAALASLMS